MGLIMLILIGTVPTAYALNHAVGHDQVEIFATKSTRAAAVLSAHGGTGQIADPKAILTTTLRQHAPTPDTIVALGEMVDSISKDVLSYGSLAKVPYEKSGNVRNDMYLTSETLGLLKKKGTLKLSASEQSDMDAYKGAIDNATKFIPTWVKVAVAVALGLGTMVGWKRIVVTVGEKIGKTHLTYAQGAAAEIVAMLTIEGADLYGLPVSTTHVLSSGVAGTMAANRSGLQASTIRNLVVAWVVTLPVAMAMSGILFWIFRNVF
jgi:PiT family inorganic phosphate transporter